jgi:hypothetical protein
MWAVMRERGVPQSTDHAVKIAEEALRRVNERFALGRLRDARHRELRAALEEPGVTPEPKTLLDAVKVARETARL